MELLTPFIQSDKKKYEFRTIYKDDLFEVVVGEASTNKGELSIGLRTLTKPFPKNAYLIFPSHFGIEFLKILICGSEYDDKVFEAIKTLLDNIKNQQISTYNTFCR